MLYVPADQRPAMTALFRVSAAMGDVLRTTSDPMIARIRLAWWRERLEELDRDHPVPAEPRLEAARRWLLPAGVSGRDLAGLAEGWERMLDPFPWQIETTEGVWFRGIRAFGLASRLLGGADERLQQAGALWALTDAARHVSDSATRAELLRRAATIAKGVGGLRYPARLRPLSMLAALAIRDIARGEPFEREGAPGRVTAMLRHRALGRLPRL